MGEIVENPSLEFLDTCDSRIRGIYHYWDSKRRGRRMPSRADIDPVEIPTYLANVILVDMQHYPLRLRYRLVGTDIVRKRGFDPTGKNVGDAFFGPDAESVLHHYRAIAERRVVRFIDAPFVEPRGWYVYSERIMMPLSDDDETVNMALVYALWRDLEFQ
jgi:hypothetical protein